MNHYLPSGVRASFGNARGWVTLLPVISNRCHPPPTLAALLWNCNVREIGINDQDNLWQGELYLLRLKHKGKKTKLLFFNSISIEEASSCYSLIALSYSERLISTSISLWQGFDLSTNDPLPYFLKLRF